MACRAASGRRRARWGSRGRNSATRAGPWGALPQCSVRADSARSCSRAGRTSALQYGRRGPTRTTRRRSKLPSWCSPAQSRRDPTCRGPPCTMHTGVDPKGSGRRGRAFTVTAVVDGTGQLARRRGVARAAAAVSPPSSWAAALSSFHGQDRRRGSNVFHAAAAAWVASVAVTAYVCAVRKIRAACARE